MSVTVLDHSRVRIQPPEGWPPDLKESWFELVNSLPADRFHASDRPLLGLYVRSLAQANAAFDQLEALADESATSPWLKAADISTKACATLAQKLRLSPSARMDRKTAAPAAREDLTGARPWD